jgi:hypothetical protein
LTTVIRSGATGFNGQKPSFDKIGQQAFSRQGSQVIHNDPQFINCCILNELTLDDRYYVLTLHASCLPISTGSRLSLIIMANSLAPTPPTQIRSKRLIRTG